MKQLIILLVFILTGCNCGVCYDEECLNGRCLGDEVTIKGSNATGYVDGFIDEDGTHRDEYNVKFMKGDKFKNKWFGEHELIFKDKARESTSQEPSNSGNVMEFKDN